MDDHLSQISTQWTVLFRAHGGPGEEVQAARRRLLEQYGSAVYRYLRAAVRDPEAADDLYQEFALKLVSGRFHRAHPDRGRFRDFLKTCLYHLIVDHQRGQRRRPSPLPAEDVGQTDGLADLTSSDQEFQAAWRGELLTRAWEELRRHEEKTGQPLHTVLRLRAEHPELRSPELAERLAAHINPPPGAGWVRKRLHFAREKFTEFLLQLVRETLNDPTEEDLQQELLDLGLFEYCRPSVRKGEGGEG